MDAIIFDIDGTLVDSTGFDHALYVRAIRDVLGDLDLREDWAEYTHVTDTGILEQILKDNPGTHGPEPVARVRARFGELVDSHLKESPCRAIDGAVQVLQALAAQAKVGIATGGWGHTARMKLRSAGFPSLDLPLVSSDEHTTRVGIMRTCRQALGAELQRVVYVGDGPWDVKASSELGWGFIGIGDALKGHCPYWAPHFGDDHWDRALRGVPFDSPR